MDINAKITYILHNDGLTEVEKFNRLAYLSLQLENTRRFAEQYEVDEAIAELKL